MTYAFPLPIPVIETERLTLRAPREADFPAMLRFAESPRAAHMATADRSQVWLYLLAGIGHWALRGYGRWSVDTKDGEFVGRIGVIFNDGWPEPELAWQVFDGAEGKGYAYEAALAARADYHARVSTHPLISMIAPGNARSIALAERLGARFERADPGIAKPFHVYRHPGPEGRA